MVRRKHIPQRMCVACRQSQEKRTLIRIVRTKDGVMIDETGKESGRGAYLHADPACWEIGIKKTLEKALNTTFKEEDRERLTKFKMSLMAGSQDEVDQELPE